MVPEGHNMSRGRHLTNLSAMRQVQVTNQSCKSYHQTPKINDPQMQIKSSNPESENPVNPSSDFFSHKR